MPASVYLRWVSWVHESHEASRDFPMPNASNFAAVSSFTSVRIAQSLSLPRAYLFLVFGKENLRDWESVVKRHYNISLHKCDTLFKLESSWIFERMDIFYTLSHNTNVAGIFSVNITLTDVTNSEHIVHSSIHSIECIPNWKFEELEVQWKQSSFYIDFILITNKYAYNVSLMLGCSASSQPAWQSRIFICRTCH